jgi:hypothetical protein
MDMNPDPVTGTAQKCAFCFASPVAKSYDAAPFLMQFAEEPFVSPQTKWPACTVCAALIDTNCWIELENHATGAFIQKLEDNGVAMGYRKCQYVRQELRRLHQCIRQAMRATA